MAECELYKEERGILEEEIREVKEGGIKSFDTLDSREKTIAKICERFLCNVWKKRNEHLNI